MKDVALILGELVRNDGKVEVTGVDLQKCKTGLVQPPRGDEDGVRVVSVQFHHDMVEKREGKKKVEEGSPPFEGKGEAGSQPPLEQNWVHFVLVSEAKRSISDMPQRAVRRRKVVIKLLFMCLCLDVAKRVGPIVLIHLEDG